MGAVQTDQGATVQLYVTRSLVGDALHRFEYHADIHLIQRVPVPFMDHERWVLRSLIFPAHWEGRFVSVSCNEDETGIYEITAPDISESMELTAA